MALAGTDLKPGIKRYILKLIKMRDWAKAHGDEEDRRMFNRWIREWKQRYWKLRRRG